MPFAANDKISKAPIQGGVEISEQEYNQAREHLLSGKLVKVDAAQVFLTEKPAQRPDHEEPEWKNGEWFHKPIEQETKTIDELAKGKRREIDSAAARAVADVRSLYPDFERETWGDQEDEARAWTADNTAPTPTLTGIAEARGVTVEYLAPKVIEKANQYRALATSVAGKRQRLEDDIAAALAAENRAGLEAIEWSNAE